ncbi:MAG: DUF4386 domain-containing protein [Reinekea sp.]|jgi:hypothetical protein
MTDELKRAARWAGWLYLLLVPLGVVGILIMPETILVKGDGAATLANLSQQKWIVQIAITSAFLIQIVQLFLALHLRSLLAPVGAFKASLIVWFTVAAMPIALLNEMFFVVLLSLDQPEFFLATLTTTQREALALSLFQWHENGIMIAHIFWGLWLIPMGYLILRSGYLPWVIGGLLLLAGVSYLLDTLVWVYKPHIEFMFANLFGWAEVLLPLWLIFKGINSHIAEQKWTLPTV